jgi:L-threonylcarbamoyladenylate synthase
VVAIPTETVYGLGCIAADPALERLLDVKGRSATKGITLAVDTVEQVRAIASVPEAAERLAGAFWPGPLTLVLEVPAGVRLPALLTAGGDALPGFVAERSIGVRLPDHAVPRAIARIVGPFALTSANVSGQPELASAREIAGAFDAGAVPLILDDGPRPGGVASTVVSVSASGEYRILRDGAIDRATIARAAGG